jgi:hypothetical protein
MRDAQKRTFRNHGAFAVSGAELRRHHQDHHESGGIQESPPARPARYSSSYPADEAASSPSDFLVVTRLTAREGVDAATNDQNAVQR